MRHFHDAKALGLKWQGPVIIGSPISGFVEYVHLESLVCVPESFVFERIRSAQLLGVNVSLRQDSADTFSVSIGGQLTAVHVPKTRALDYFKAMGFMRDVAPADDLLIKLMAEEP